MWKQIIVPMTGSADDDEAMHVALRLGEQFGAQVSALQMVELPAPAYNAWSILPNNDMDDLYYRLRAAARERDEAWQKRLAKEAPGARSRVVEALFVSAWEAASHEALFADLVVVGGFERRRNDDPPEARDLASLLLRGARPVLIVPRHPAWQATPRHIVVAWRSTRESARALHDALPLLRQAATVELVSVDAPETDALEHERQTLLAYLELHGINARWLQKKSRGRAISEVVLAAARRADSDLIVSGGYGHSRLREWALGGVTRELLHQGEFPVLMSH